MQVCHATYLRAYVQLTNLVSMRFLEKLSTSTPLSSFNNLEYRKYKFCINGILFVYLIFSLYQNELEIKKLHGY